MIKWAIELQEAINRFIVAAMTENRTSKLKVDRLDADQLSEEDWKELEMLLKLLRLFRELTLELQDNIHGARVNGAVFDVLLAMDMLSSMLEDAKKIYQVQKSPFVSCINLAWIKLDEYYGLSDKSSVYVIAVVM